MAARNPLSPSTDHPLPIAPCGVHPGLIVHPLMTPTVQVQILSIVDATGSASIGDIIGELPPHHDDPVGAIFTLIDATVLTVLTPGVIDADSLVARADYDGPRTGGCIAPPLEDDSGSAEGAPNPSPAPAVDLDSAPLDIATPTEPPLPRDLSFVPTCGLQPKIVVGPGACRTAFARVECLKAPGIYVLLRDQEAYVGYGSDTGFRIIDGRQMPNGAPDCIIAIVDEHDGLDLEDAKALERIFWTAVTTDPDFTLINGVPCGAAVTPMRYNELRLFTAQIMLALRHAGLMFVSGSVREHLAGPIAEPDRLGEGSDAEGGPEGMVQIHRADVSAQAWQCDDGTWRLLAGSEVRTEVSASASSSAAFLRAAWLHAGLLEPARDGSRYTLKHDMIFPSAGTLGSFVAGGKRARFTPCEPLDACRTSGPAL